MSFMRLVVLLVIIIVNSRRGSGGGTGRVGGLSPDSAVGYRRSWHYKNNGLAALGAPGLTKTMVWELWALLGLQKQ